MSSLITHFEHFNGKVEVTLPFLKSGEYKYDFLKGKEEQNCFTITKDDEAYHCALSYYVGVDWIAVNKTALHVAPKLNKSHGETDFLKMLFSALKHPDVSRYADQLYEIKFDAPYIEISHQQDLLTPLLIVQFLRITQQIVRKGLKKSYYKVIENLHAKVKGKVVVGQTIKQNTLKNKPLHTVCAYDQFGINGLENRLLKKTLIFVQQYLPLLKVAHSTGYALTLLNYIMPAFGQVNEDVKLSEIKHSKINPFYKEYTEATSLARLILKRFGYNITNAHQAQIVKTPPFWIDMSKLFELYVLGLLKDRFPEVNTINYQFGNRGSKLDYLLNSTKFKMVVDAKYKTKYDNSVDHLDIRQVSGYARLEKVYKTLDVEKGKLIDCLIIYPDQESGLEKLPEDLRSSAIQDYVGVYKIAVRLPMLTPIDAL